VRFIQAGFRQTFSKPVEAAGDLLTSRASQELEIHNSTPWREFWYVVNSNEVTYFNSSTYWTGNKVLCPSVSRVVNTSGNSPGQVVSGNSPYEFKSGTYSNGVQYVTYSGDVPMADTALTVDGPATITNTNILVDCEAMGNGNILIKYWVDNTAITNGWTGIEDIASVFSEPGG